MVEGSDIWEMGLGDQTPTGVVFPLGYIRLQQAQQEILVGPVILAASWASFVYWLPIVGSRRRFNWCWMSMSLAIGFYLLSRQSYW